MRISTRVIRYTGVQDAARILAALEAEREG
jgi:hypothetical protein